MEEFLSDLLPYFLPGIPYTITTNSRRVRARSPIRSVGVQPQRDWRRRGRWGKCALLIASARIIIRAHLHWKCLQFLVQEDFTSNTLRPGQTVSGTYTKKIYRLRSKAPWVLQKLLPPEAFVIYEESWNAYPYCKTVLTVSLNFSVILFFLIVRFSQLKFKFVLESRLHEGQFPSNHWNHSFGR